MKSRGSNIRISKQFGSSAKKIDQVVVKIMNDGSVGELAIQYQGKYVEAKSRFGFDAVHSQSGRTHVVSGSIADVMDVEAESFQSKINFPYKMTVSCP